SAPYSILGTISGPATGIPITVLSGDTNAPVINGNYAIHGLPAGTHLVMPHDTNYLFVPFIQDATVGPDKVGVNFKSYQWDKLAIEDVTNGTMHVIFPVFSSFVGYTTNVRVFASSDLLQWSPISTNAIIPFGYYSELFIPIGNEPARFFRAIAP